MRNTKKGFTLVELLVVIAILAILATVSVVGYTNYIKNANESLALQELSQVKSSILAEDIVNNDFAIGSDGKVNAEGVAKFNEYLAGLATDLNGNLEYVDGTVVYTLEKDTSVVYVLDLKTGEVEAGTATQTPVTPPAGGEEGGETGGETGGEGNEGEQAPELTKKTYTHTMVKKDFTDNLQDDGTIVLSNVTWKLVADSEYFGWDGNSTAKGIQFGSGSNPNHSMTLTSASFNNVSKVTINTSGAKSVAATFIVKVNGTQVGEAKTVTVDATDYTFTLDTPVTGEIEIVYTQTSDKALYIKSISVEYAE